MRRWIGLTLVLGFTLAQGFKAELRTALDPLLEALEGEAGLLAQGAAAWAQAPSEAGLYRLRLHWRGAREAWEELEAFALPPVEELDPLLDTWPISPEDLKRTQGTPREALPPEARGFHALEYLLFAHPPRTPAERAQLLTLAQDLAANARALRAQVGAYLDRAGEEELKAELRGAVEELAEELFAEKLSGPESPYAGRSAEDYRANLRGLLKALALLPLSERVYREAEALERSFAALPAPLEGRFEGPALDPYRNAARAFHRTLLEDQDARGQARGWLRAFREEYLGEGEADEGLEALAGLEKALQGTPLWPKAQPLLEGLRAKVKAQAPKEEVEALVRALEELLR